MTTSRSREWLASAGLTIASILVALIVLELGCRLARGPSWLVRWPNLVLDERIDTKSQGVGRLVPDTQLGFVARPGFTARSIPSAAGTNCFSSSAIARSASSPLLNGLPIWSFIPACLKAAT